MLHGVAYGPNGQALLTQKPFNGEELLAFSSFHEQHGVFKAVSLAAEGTQIVSSPDPGGALVLTSFLVSAKKKTASVLILQVTDGVQTESIFEALLTNEAVNMPVPLVGGWRGWKDARLEVVLTGADTDVRVTAGYTKIREGEEYSAWDARR